MTKRNMVIDIHRHAQANGLLGGLVDIAQEAPFRDFPADNVPGLLDEASLQVDRDAGWRREPLKKPLHTFHLLWPVRRYPHLRISARGLEPSGTSTHLTRQLSALRHTPQRNCPRDP